MADFFDRLLAKSAPVPQPAADHGVKSVVAQPRLPQPFERPTTVGDLDWDEQAPPESDHSRRGNAMELRSEPTSGTRTAVPAGPRSVDPASFQPRPDARSWPESELRPLIAAPSDAERPLPRRRPPVPPSATSQSPSRLTVPQTSPDFPGPASILGSPAGHIPAIAMPAARQPRLPSAPPALARPAERGAPPVRRAAAAPQPPSVTVRIGRLEVRAATPPPAHPAARPDRRTREPALKLDAYLAREGGRR